MVAEKFSIARGAYYRMRPEGPTDRAAIYVDGTALLPTFKKAAEPAGIARAGLEIVSGVLLSAGDRSRLVVADPYARQVLAYRPDDRVDELAILHQISRIARSMVRSRSRKAWAWT